MTPKEKAKELVGKFYNIDSDAEMFDGFEMKLFYAQRCAIIAVDQILDVIDRDMNYQNVYSFYFYVKEEIEKLRSIY